jgi:hypothetical protein
VSEQTSTPAAISQRARDGSALLEADAPPQSVELDTDVLALEGVHTALCPQCGVNPAGPPRAWTFRWGHPLLTVAWLVGAWMSSVVISPFVGLGLLGGAFFARRTVKTTLTLCDDCDAAARRAKRIRAATVAGGFFSPVLAGVVMMVLNEAGLIDSPFVRGAAFGVTVVAGLAGAVFGHLKTAKSALFIQKIRKKVLKLKASPTWARVLREEQPAALAQPSGEAEQLEPAEDDNG